MPSAGAGGRDSVRRHLSVVVAANLLVLLVVGIAGIVGTVRAHDSVHYVTERVEPAIQTNAAVLQDLTDVETYLWGWGISGDPTLLESYRASVDRYRADRERLASLGHLEAEVALLVAGFERTADTWFSTYVDRRLTQATGPQSFHTNLFERGLRLFGDLRSANAAVARQLDHLSQDSARRADDLTNRMVAILVAVLVLGALSSSVIGRQVGRRVTQPLGELETTANQLAVGRHEARAPVSGPARWSRSPPR